MTSSFPKVGDWIVTETPFHTVNNVILDMGMIIEVLSTAIKNYNGEIYNYFIYLGLESGSILEINYTLHKDRFKVIPNTKAAEVLYGRS